MLTTHEDARLRLISYLSAEDPNGCYSDADCQSEGIVPLGVDNLIALVMAIACDNGPTCYRDDVRAMRRECADGSDAACVFQTLDGCLTVLCIRQASIYS